MCNRNDKNIKKKKLKENRINETGRFEKQITRKNIKRPHAHLIKGVVFE